MPEFFNQNPWVIAVMAAVIIVVAVLVVLYVVLIKGSTHTIRFDTDGAKPVKSERHRSGSLVKLPVPENNGEMRFAGWYFDKELKHIAIINTMPKSNVLLYAAWVEDEPVQPSAPIVEDITEEEVVVAEDSVPEEKAQPAVTVVPVAVVAAEDSDDADDGEEFEESEGAEGQPLTPQVIRDKKPESFRTRIKEGADCNKVNYTALLNLALSRKGVTAGYTRRSVNIRYKGETVAKILFAGDYLKMALALDPAEVDPKFRTRDYSQKHSYKQIPVVITMQGERALKRAIPLLTQALDRVGAPERKKYKESTFVELALVHKGNPIVKLGKQELLRERISAPDTTVIKDISVADLIQVRAVQNGEDLIYGSVTTEQLTDKFADGEYVTLRSAKARGLVSAEATALKITAKGALSKSLNVTADKIAPAAVKMIVLTGGKVTLLCTESQIEAEREAAFADDPDLSADIDDFENELAETVPETGVTAETAPETGVTEEVAPVENAPAEEPAGETEPAEVAPETETVPENTEGTESAEVAEAANAEPATETEEGHGESEEPAPVDENTDGEAVNAEEPAEETATEEPATETEEGHGESEEPAPAETGVTVEPAPVDENTDGETEPAEVALETETVPENTEGTESAEVAEAANAEPAPETEEVYGESEEPAPAETSVIEEVAPEEPAPVDENTDGEAVNAEEPAEETATEEVAPQTETVPEEVVPENAEENTPAEENTDGETEPAEVAPETETVSEEDGNGEN